MKKELTNIFGNVFLTIEEDRKNRWVYNDWIGYLTMDNVKTGAITYLDTVRESGYSKVLNSNVNVLGSWEHSIEWVLNDWEPMAAKSGIKHFAMIVSENSMTEPSALHFAELIKDFEVKLFHDKAEAEHWLRLQV